MILAWVGGPVDWQTALALEIGSVLIDGILFFVPAKVGTQEGGKVLLFAMLGLDPARGLTVGVVRRIRELTYAGLGLAVLAWLTTRPVAEGSGAGARARPFALTVGRMSDRPALRTLFLHPPSFEGFDGGAGSRYQARREIRSFWYPTWLAQPAAMVPGSRLIDAPPDGLTLDQVAPLARDYELAVLHTSTPSFANDARVAARLKEENPRIQIGMVGAHVGVLPEQSLNGAPCGRLGRARGVRLHLRGDRRGPAPAGGRRHRLPRWRRITFTPPRPTIEDMDALPFVIDVYKRDLTIENYFIGYLLHPYVSLYTGRGCRSKCTFCLWPQTLGGHRYRVRSADNVEAEMAQARMPFPQVKEFFFDDDTFTDDLPRAEDIARRLGRLGLTWSCNAKANVPEDAGNPAGQRAAAAARRLRVGQPADTEQHQEGCSARHRARVHQERRSRWASRSTARSSWVCPARRRRRSGRPSATRARSSRRPSRCRWPPLSGHRAVSPSPGARLASDPDG